MVADKSPEASPPRTDTVESARITRKGGKRDTIPLNHSFGDKG